MTDIPSNSFAAACFDQNTVAELEEALQGAADESDCKAWNITPEQWREQIQLALAAKTEEA